MTFNLAVVKESDDIESDHLLAESLIAGFIVQMHDSEDPVRVAMAAGAALALQCSEDPHGTVEMIDAKADPMVISRLGVKAAKDIATAHETVHRIQTLIDGLAPSEVEATVEAMLGEGRKWKTRADLMRDLETMLLEHKANTGD